MSVEKSYEGAPISLTLPGESFGITDKIEKILSKNKLRDMSLAVIQGNLWLYHGNIYDYYELIATLKSYRYEGYDIVIDEEKIFISTQELEVLYIQAFEKETYLDRVNRLGLYVLSGNLDGFYGKVQDFYDTAKDLESKKGGPFYILYRGNSYPLSAKHFYNFYEFIQKNKN